MSDNEIELASDDEIELAIDDDIEIASPLPEDIDFMGILDGTWLNTDGDTAVVVSDNVEVSDEDLRQAFLANPELKVIGEWADNTFAPQRMTAADPTRNRSRRTTGLFERDRYVTPNGLFDQFKVAREAAENDDVVSGVIEATEALVFSSIRVECGDEDEENIWDQIIQDMNLETRLHEMWRDLFVYSQFYAAKLMGRRTYKVQGQGEQRARRKEYKVNIPIDISLMDPMKVVPNGDFLFGQEDLLYLANKSETEDITNVIAGKNTSDQVVTQLLVEHVELEREEARHLKEVLGNNVALDNLFSMNPALTWRCTATRPSYMRFAPVRMKSIFELLDLKHQLRQMDRVHLLGGTNFIVLVRKGSDALPADATELAHLNSAVSNVARVPLIVGDHRLSVDIVTPKLDTTLDPKRYNNLDSRITSRLYQIFHLGGFTAGASGDDSLKLSRVVARGLEARRALLKDNVERNLLIPIFESNKGLKCRPHLEFTPRQVALAFDPNFLRLMAELYQMGDVSRETMLGIVDLKQENEAHNREVEAERYDDLFPPREVNASIAGGQQGGNQNGGGDNPDSGTPNREPRRPDADVDGPDGQRRNDE